MLSFPGNKKMESGMKIFFVFRYSFNWISRCNINLINKN